MSPAFLPTPPVLRELSGGRSSTANKTGRRPRRPEMTVHRITGPSEYAAALPPPQKNPLSPLVVFSFITRNCRACKYASNAYRRLANDFALHAGGREVRFCEMDVSERQNQQLGQSLGVNAVPTFQFYAFKGDDRRGGGVGVLDEVVGPRMVGKVREKLSVYLSDGFSLDDYVFED